MVAIILIIAENVKIVCYELPCVSYLLSSIFLKLVDFECSQFDRIEKRH